MATDLTYAYAADITKVERDAAGNLMVYGNATDSTLDLDEQVADPEWLKKAMPDWQRWGNLREMHQPIVAGIGKTLEEGPDGKWLLKSEVIDAGTAKKIEAGALKGYSIGIKNARVITDKAAPGGRIVGGTIVEVSYVDRPCNPSAVLSIAKAVGADLAGVEKPSPAVLARMLGKDAATDVTKCNSGDGTDDSVKDSHGQVGDSTDNADQLDKPRKTRGNPKPPKKGKKVQDLTSTHADGKPKAADADKDVTPVDYDKAAIDARRKVKKAMKAADLAELRARIANLEKRVTATGDVVDSSGKDRSGVADADFAGPGKTFPIETQSDVSDAASLAHHAADPSAVRAKIKSIALRKWPSMQLPPSLDGKDVSADTTKGVSADVIKAAVDDATKQLRSELETLKKTVVPGGPVVTAKTAVSEEKAAERADLEARAAKYRGLASSSSDRELAHGYEELAKTVEASLTKAV